MIPKILTWNDRFALIDRFTPTDDAIVEVFNITPQELTVARNLRTTGTFIASKHLDYDSYAAAFSSNKLTSRRLMNNKSTSITLQPPDGAETATRTVHKRGRKGSNITTAFSNVPLDPINATEFAATNKVSIAVLRQSKRFDPYTDKGQIHVKKNKESGNLMIWRDSGDIT